MDRVSRVGLCILLVAMFIVLLTEVVWGHRTHLVVKEWRKDRLRDSDLSLGADCYHAHSWSDEKWDLGWRGIACYTKEQVDRFERKEEPAPVLPKQSDNTPVPSTPPRINPQDIVSNRDPTPNDRTVSVSTPFVSSVTPTPTVIKSTINQIVVDAVDKQEEMPAEIPQIEEEIVEYIVELVYHEYQWYQGLNLVSFPVMREDIVTISDLYNEYPLFNSPQDAIIVYSPEESKWYAYNGEYNAVGDTLISPYLGILMKLDYSSLLGMRGVKIIGDGVVKLKAGLNILGLTELPARYSKPSDIASDPNVIGIITRTTGKITEIPKWYFIGREGDSGDEHPLAIGQAIIILCYGDMTINLSNGVSAAPAATRVLTMTWGAIKQRN